MIGEQFRTNCISSDQTIRSGFFTIDGDPIVTNKTNDIEENVMSLLIYNMPSQFNFVLVINNSWARSRRELLLLGSEGPSL